MDYAIIVSSSHIELLYNSPGNPLSEGSYSVNDLLLDPNHWHHIAVTVVEEDAAFYINGTVVGVTTLENSVMDNGLRDIKLGQISSGEGEK